MFKSFAAKAWIYSTVPAKALLSSLRVGAICMGLKCRLTLGNSQRHGNSVTQTLYRPWMTASGLDSDCEMEF